MMSPDTVCSRRCRLMCAAVVALFATSEASRLLADDQTDDQTEAAQADAKPTETGATKNDTTETDAPKTYVLSYHFAPGSSVDYTVENHSQIEVEQAGAEQQVDHSQTSHKHYRVVSVDEDGNGFLELTIDRAQMQATVDGDAPVTYDSQKDRQPPAQFIGIAGTIGKPHARITASPAGELLAIDWLVASDQDALPTKKDAGNLDILVRLPETPVAIGEKWKQRFKTEVTVNEKLRKTVTLLRTYRLVSVDGNRATIELRTSVITPLHDPAQEAQLIQKTPSGTIEFDLDRGVLLSRSTKLDREVVGFNGGKSRIRNQTTRSERISEVATTTDESSAVKTAKEGESATR